MNTLSSTMRAGCLGALLFSVLCACGAREDAIALEDADDITLTWLSVTSWLLEAGDTRVLMDGYVSRVDRTTVNADGTSTAFAPLDTAAVDRVRRALLPDGGLDWILLGHGHWDHAFDTPAWSMLTGARIAGARTICHQAAAFDVPAERCTPVEGGEVITLGPGVRARAVRWHHSGDSTNNGRVLRAPLELRGPPPVDSATGGLRPGFIEDYPNGGGARAWLVTIETGSGPVTLFWSNTGNVDAWDVAIDADSVLFREQHIDTRHLEWAASDEPTRDHLAEALAAESLDGVDLWIGWGNDAHVRQVSELLRPRHFAPQHWDDFWTPLHEGPGRAFRSSGLERLGAAAGFAVLVPAQYFDRIRLNVRGATLEDGAALREALGIRTFEADSARG